MFRIAVIVLSVIKDDEDLKPVVDPTQQQAAFQISNKVIPLIKQKGMTFDYDFC